MPPISKRRRASRSSLATKRQNIKMKKFWDEKVAEFDAVDLSNENGRTRTFQENRIVLLAIKMVLKIYLKAVEDKTKSINDVKWSSIEKEIATSFHMRRQHVTELRQQFFEDGDVLVFNEQEENADKTEAQFERDETARKLKRSQLQKVIDEVDDRHAQGKTVTNQFMRNFIRKKLQVDVSRATMSAYFRQLGLQWKPVKVKKRNIGAYRMDLLREYLIKLDGYYKKYIADKENCPFVFVFTDESYVHRTHASQSSYMHEDSQVNRSSSKGQRLIILHAITPDGPLCERIDGIPVDDLQWNGDTPHPQPREDGKLTCELIWKAASSSGDYHDNMNSKMFLRWVNEKLIPTFDRLYPDKKMVLVCDNAPYHHKRELGSLASKTKKDLVEIGEKYGIQYIDVPFKEERYQALIAEEHDNVEMHDDYFRVAFDPEVMKERTNPSKPFIPSTEELQVGIVRYVKDNLPELLDCQVQKALNDKGHTILWTPPYTPELQPIEVFWGVSKNHVALNSSFDVTMKDTVRHLREGWYGNLHLFPLVDDAKYDIIEKEPVDCYKLFMKTIDIANTKYIKLCAGLSGEMGSLQVDDNHIVNKEGLPIDLLILDVMKDEEKDEETDPITTTTIINN